MQYTIKATIPTGNYANIQPELTVEANSPEEARAMVLPHIMSMFSEFSDQPLKSKGEPVQLKSFCEDLELTFDPISHTYTYKDQPLMSASGFVKQFTPEFDKVAISKTCEKAWGVPQQDILDMWKGNGDAAAGFGTAVHASLEHYFNFKELGNTIFEKSKNKTENAALPNHPLIKKIILEFEEIDTQEGVSHQEVLVSNVQRGYCGLVDNLLVRDLKKKICRVRDYKITYDVTVEDKKNAMTGPFSDLSPTKLSKYQVQLSFYANLLEMAGWTVEGLDVFNYDEQWTHHELPVLKVLE